MYVRVDYGRVHVCVHVDLGADVCARVCGRTWICACVSARGSAEMQRPLPAWTCCVGGAPLVLDRDLEPREGSIRGKDFLWALGAVSGLGRSRGSREEPWLPAAEVRSLYLNGGQASGGGQWGTGERGRKGGGKAGLGSMDTGEWAGEGGQALRAFRGCFRRKFSLDELLTNVMLYWTTGSITSSQRFYKENLGQGFRAHKHDR